MTTNDAPFLNKQALRQQMRERLKDMTVEQISRASEQLVRLLMSEKAPALLSSHSIIALFGGLAGEPDLLPLIPRLVERGCTPVFFGFSHDQLVPRAVRRADDLERGVFGVWKPRDDLPMVELGDLDVILTPGLAFDKAGHRLGRGRGYYDRLFADPQAKAKRIALGFDLQLVDAVPVDPHDALMHEIITETGAKMEI